MPTIWRSALPDIDPTPVLLHEEIFASAERWPGRTAVADAVTGDVLTYSELTATARRLAGGLRGVGAQPDDVLALVAGNGTVFPMVLFGALAAGLTVALANPMLTANELTRLLDRVRPRYVVADPALPAVGPATAACAAEAVYTTGRAAGMTPIQTLAAGAPLPPQPGDPGARALLFSTSGTSGLPKSAIHTHASAVASLRQLDSVFTAMRPADVVSGMVLFSTFFGALLLGQTLRAGARFVTLPRFEMEGFLGLLRTHRVTVAGGPPPLALALARHPLVDRYDLSSLRKVLVAGAPMPAAVAQACQARLDCTVGQAYGLTEMCPASAPLKGGKVVQASVGQLPPSTEAVVVGPSSRERLDAGQTGELWMRGPQIMRGYVGDDDATASTIDADGWLHTGDLGYFDEHDNLFLVDRVKELIKHRGYQVAPAELEAELTALPAVADAAVIPRPHPEAGEVPVAYVVLHHPVPPSDLVEWLAGRLAPWKQLWDVAVVEEIPRSPAGKLLRRVLVERDREQAERAASQAGAAGASAPALLARLGVRCATSRGRRFLREASSGTARPPKGANVRTRGPAPARACAERHIEFRNQPMAHRSRFGLAVLLAECSS